MTQIAIILGSTRKVAAGQFIFDYLKQHAPKMGNIDYQWLDLKKYQLPFYNHSETPLAQPLTDLTTNEKNWLNALKQADGYLILTPEYDHALPGELKNALDYVGPEVARKPVQILSYTSYSDGGVLAAESLVPILQMLKTLVLPNPILISQVNDNFAADGRLLATAPSGDYYAQRLTNGIKELIFYSQLLKTHPFHSPYDV